MENMMKNSRTLFDNTLMLYLLTFSNYFFGFIVIPYETRVLGPQYFGKLAFAIAFISYFQILIDFGFMLSATADVSKNIDNKKKLSEIMSSVIYAKLLLSFFSTLILISIIIFLPSFRVDFWFYILVFFSIAINSFLPDYLYRGLEKMKYITYRTILIRLFFTLMIFAFLKDKTQYYYIPIINMIGGFIAIAAAYIHLNAVFKIKIVKVDLSKIIHTLKISSNYFLSRIATTIYTSTNVFIIGIMYPESKILGYYGSSNKLIGTITSMYSPIADSMYPHMIKTKDYNLMKKTIKVGTLLVLFFAMFIGIWSSEISILIFGPEFKDASLILVLLLPIVVIAFPNYLLGFPSLSPLGLEKYANLSTIYGSIFQITGIIILYLIGFLNYQSICVLTCFTEALVLSIRLIVFLTKGKKIILLNEKLS
jgi:O-antigen/teichoic acid export membrane protein